MESKELIDIIEDEGNPELDLPYDKIYDQYYATEMSIMHDENGVLTAVSIGGDLVGGVNVPLLELEYPMNSYVYNGETIKYDEILHLDIVKKLKQDELREVAIQKTNQGFMFEGVVIPFETDDRIRLAKIETGFRFTDIIRWVASSDFNNKRDTSIDITEDMLNGLGFGVMFHETFIISILNEVLRPMIANAKTIEEVNAISWDLIDIPHFEAYVDMVKCRKKLTELKSFGLKL